MKPAEKVSLLFDFAATKPEGFTYLDVDEKLGWSRDFFVRVARDLRLMFKGDTITLTCEPGGHGLPWIYKLVGNYDGARPWATNRIGDMESRLETVHAVAETLVNATDGRSQDGRKARKVQRTIGRLIEDLADISGES